MGAGKLACARASVRARVRACVLGCVPACMRPCVCVSEPQGHASPSVMGGGVPAVAVHGRKGVSVCGPTPSLVHGCSSLGLSRGPLCQFLVSKSPQTLGRYVRPQGEAACMHFSKIPACRTGWAKMTVVSSLGTMPLSIEGRCAVPKCFFRVAFCVRSARVCNIYDRMCFIFRGIMYLHMIQYGRRAV